jgi:C1A family cysteine protease
MNKTRHTLGWKRDLPDQRDHIYSARHYGSQLLPLSIDLRPGCPPIYDQLQLGSCTANALAGALEFDAIKQKEAPVTPSRLFVYYNERAREGTVASDAGASLRDGIKSVNRQGACPESEWPYDITQFAVQPPAQCYEDAMQHKALTYQRLAQSLAQMKTCLAEGYPILFGFSVYSSFESDAVAQTGIVPMPGHNEVLLGGHAVLCVGFREDEQIFTIRNSWGDAWGDHGYCYMPYAYLLSSSLASDFWTVRTVQ